MKSNLLLGTYRDVFAKKHGGVYSIEEWLHITWSPDSGLLAEAESFTIHGKTYKEKQSYAREHAIRLQQMMSEIDLSYWDYDWLGWHFENIGRRYGLLTEFRENGLC